MVGLRENVCERLRFAGEGRSVWEGIGTPLSWRLTTPNDDCGLHQKRPKQWKPLILHKHLPLHPPLLLTLPLEWNGHVVAMVWASYGATGLGESPYGVSGNTGWNQKEVGGRKRRFEGVKEAAPNK